MFHLAPKSLPTSSVNLAVAVESKVNVRLRVSVRFIWVCSSGNRYVFNALQALPVEPDDATELLALQHRGGGCCGFKSSDFHYFELA